MTRFIDWFLITLPFLVVVAIVGFVFYTNSFPAL